jgi:hypothetical protein
VAKSPWKTPDQTIFLGRKAASFLAIHARTGALIYAFQVENEQELPRHVLHDPEIILLGRTGSDRPNPQIFR